MREKERECLKKCNLERQEGHPDRAEVQHDAPGASGIRTGCPPSSAGRNQWNEDEQHGGGERLNESGGGDQISALNQRGAAAITERDQFRKRTPSKEMKEKR